MLGSLWSLLLVFPTSLALTSVVTGASGYLGRAIVHELLGSNEDHPILALVRPTKVASEQAYWNDSPHVHVCPYDMLDGGVSFQEVLSNDTTPCTVYHVASVFGPTDEHAQTALDNVQGTQDLIGCLTTDNCHRLVLTSSMAAVRGTGQTPQNGAYYTADDWNNVSQKGANWGASYQWSKMESERIAWELCRERGIPLTTLCPSFVFGPPYDASGSYSLELVGQWVHGASPVQSRLFVDVRDVAQAHVAAGNKPEAVNQRYIVSTEARVPSGEIADWMKDVCRRTGLGEADKIHYDADFDGGAIKIGDREVEATDRLEKELGIRLRPVRETIEDMAQVLLQ